MEFLSTQCRAWRTILERGLKGLVAIPTILDLVPSIEGFPGGLAGKESACNVGDLGSIPGLRRCPGEGKGYPLQYSGLENFMDCIVHGVSESVTAVTSTFFHLL